MPASYAAPLPPMPQTTVIQTMSHIPMMMKCDYCKKDGLTKVERLDGLAVWATCIACCIFLNIFSCFGGCAFCIGGLKDVQHYCSHCRALLAVRKPCT